MLLVTSKSGNADAIYNYLVPSAQLINIKNANQYVQKWEICPVKRISALTFP